MAHRRLVMEWNRNVPLAIERGLTLGMRTPVGCTLRTYPDWRISRSEAEARVAWIRSVTGGATGQAVVDLSAFAPPPRRPRTPRHVLEPAFVGFEWGSWTFGVEFEVFIPRGTTRSQLAEKLREAGIECTTEVYNHSTLPRWKLVTDGSLGNYNTGSELVSPVLSGPEGIRQVEVACRVLKEFGCKATKRCGFHVHVGARDLPLSFWKNTLRTYRNHETTIDGLVAPSRRLSINPYCRTLLNRFSERRLVEADTFQVLAPHYQPSDRYHKVNAQSFWRHGTIEFRQHQGTIDGDKAVRWIEFVLRLCQKSNVTVEDAPATLEGGSTLEGLMSWIGSPPELTSYFQHRSDRLASEDARTLRRLAA
jgi:hypothetical protein